MTVPDPDPLPPSSAGLGGYVDACATSPPSRAALNAIERAQRLAWANPSSLHGPGLLAAELLERSRQQLASDLGCDPEELLFCSGASEALHLALLGSGAAEKPGRLLISAVEHPATLAAAAQLEQRGWQVAVVPVDGSGMLRLEAFADLLAPPTRLVSLIWGQSEVGSLQPIAAAAELCQQRGVCLHVDAVQVLGHRRFRFDDLPVDLLSCCAHKLQGPRGIGALLVRQGRLLRPLIGGGGQERGRRGGTEAVALAAGFAAATAEAVARLRQGAGQDPIQPLRDRLLGELLRLPGIRLTGPEPGLADRRLPHHISVLVSDQTGRPLSGRALVRAMARRGFALSSGSACSSNHGQSASPVLLAMGFSPEEAAAGLRISLGPWNQAQDLQALPQALAEARDEVAAATATPP
ncbi:MAG: cysteine desulfurase family protein [Synechococcaceae cyanobacterium]